MTENLSAITQIYVDAFALFDPKRAVPAINVSFYPYVGINHTIRVRDGKVFIRIAELCREMPLREQKALAYILVAKLLRKRVPPAARETYAAYIKQREVRESALVRKKTKGRKIVSSAKGEFFDLDELFEQINSQYFQNSIPKPVLTWSARETFRILGHHDAAHDTIVISRSLDHATTPEFVVSYILYHEMLHIFHPTEIRDGRRYNHTPEFRRNEKKFRFYDAAERWIEDNIRSIRKRAMKR